MQHNSDRKRSLFAFPWWMLAAAVCGALVLRAVALQVYFVPSGSMRPTLAPGDRVLVDKLSHWWATPQRGELVVFDGTDVWGAAANGVLLTKRVVGIAGDHVVCCDSQDRIVLNGSALTEPYARGRSESFDVIVPAGRLWVLGDDRRHSRDSSTYGDSTGGGSVPVNHVLGRVLAVVWPIPHAGILAPPHVRGTS